MRPIPKRLLCHSAELYAAATDDWGSATETLKGNLTYIRIEPSEAMAADKNGNDIRCTAKLFFDAANSGSEGAVFAPGDIVLWNNTRYIVRAVKQLYGANTLHHLEVELSDG